jgi:hypothetical protein
MDLLEMDRREEHLRGAERQLAGFDAAAYEAAAELLAGPGSGRLQGQSFVLADRVADSC